METTRQTRFAGILGKAAVVAGLAAGLALAGGFDHLDAHHADEDNHFVRHPGAIGGRTEIDLYDPDAPVDLGGAVIATGGATNARAVAGESEAGEGYEWSSSPRLPGRPY
jgi:hypothetical protein